MTLPHPTTCPDGSGASRRVGSFLPPGWELIRAADHARGSAAAADWLTAAVLNKPDLLLCAATGSSPARTYELFAQSLRARADSGRALRIIQLDEWVGLRRTDPATCEASLEKFLLRPLSIRRGNKVPDVDVDGDGDRRFVGFESDAISPEDECLRVGSWLENNGPVDVGVLGLGVNGHLGLNEPADALTPDIHVTELTPETRAHPMLAGTDRRPSRGMTLGLRAILASRSILLLVFGAGKAAQLERLFCHGISTRFPASFLKLHQRVVCVCDEAAAARLPGGESD